jgi:hypothetical protein
LRVEALSMTMCTSSSAGAARSIAAAAASPELGPVEIGRLVPKIA